MKVKYPMTGAKMGYSEILKSKKEEVILIKPKNTKQTSTLTRRKLEETLNPCTLGVEWWKGPYWLSGEQSKWPNEQPEAGSVPELKSPAYLAGQFESTLDFPFEKFSSFNKLRNVIAYILRFKENSLKTGNDRRKGDLTPHELNRATKTLIKTCDIKDLKNGNELRLSNKLSGLTPLPDREDILRVGGRLKYSDYDFDKRHPILLPGKHQLTKLIFHQEHNRLLHADPQLLLSTIRDTYWPISGRNLARDTVRKCPSTFGDAGRQSTFPSYNSVKGGEKPKAHCLKTPWFYSRTTIPCLLSGSYDGSCIYTQAPTAFAE
ncbi:hypothetical protein JTB14_012212 [Gonioctena quinquepunctata]|nr:hypothetical protein JTB14_012212 [Gonioctena quinquepunctata]